MLVPQKIIIILVLSMLLLLQIQYYFLVISAATTQDCACDVHNNTVVVKDSEETILSIITADKHEINGEEFVFIHIIWVSDETVLNRKVETAFRSALRTQSNARILIWTLPEYVQLLQTQVSHLQHSNCSISSNLEIISIAVLADLVSQTVDPAIRSCEGALSTMTANRVAFSDLFRFIVLFFFGGIYVDADCIFLRDMHDLHGQSFAYKWDRDVTYYNTAILGLPKGSHLVSSIIRQDGRCDTNTFYPTRIHEKMDCTSGVCIGLVMMPTALFNPSSGVQTNWQWNSNEAHDLGMTTDWFFNRARLWDLEHFFPGAYTFHWHNRWNNEVHENSFFADLERLNANCNLSSRFTPSRAGRKVFVDLGAYNGDTLQTYGKRFIQEDDGLVKYLHNEVYVFEVDFKHIRSILDRLEGELSYLKPITHLYNAAVWKQDTVLNFKSTGHNDGRISDVGEQLVLAYDIGAWFMRTILPLDVDNILVKIDIEGAEVESLRSLADANALKFVDHLIVEWHDWIIPEVAVAKQAIVELLAANGLHYHYATLDDNIDTHFGIGQPWPVNHCDSHYFRALPAASS